MDDLGPPCPHLAAHVRPAAPGGPRVVTSWRRGGLVHVVDREPPTALLAGPPLRAVLGTVQTDGWTAGWQCDEHGEVLVWGDGPWPQCSRRFWEAAGRSPADYRRAFEPGSTRAPEDDALRGAAWTAVGVVAVVLLVLLGGLVLAVTG